MQLNELVNLHFDDLNESDLYIWNYINNHREVCTKITIEDLGKNVMFQGQRYYVFLKNWVRGICRAKILLAQ